MTRMAPDGTVLATIELEGAPAALGFDGKSIWVTSVWGILNRLSLDGEILSFLSTAANPVAIAWDGQAFWIAHAARPDAFSGTTTKGLVSRLQLHDAPLPSSPLETGPQEVAPPDADLAQYVLAQDQVQQVPGCAGWTDVPGYDMVEFIEEVPGWAALLEGLDVQDALEASGCGRSEGPVEVDATQVVFRFASQEGATRFMERLRVPAYPFLVMSEPLLSTYAGYRGMLEFETWFKELDPQALGPGAFAVETSAALPALLEELVGLRGHAEDGFHGWVRYGNLVSLLLVQAGADLEERLA